MKKRRPHFEVVPVASVPAERKKHEKNKTISRLPPEAKDEPYSLPSPQSPHRRLSVFPYWSDSQ